MDDSPLTAAEQVGADALAAWRPSRRRDPIGGNGRRARLVLAAARPLIETTARADERLKVAAELATSTVTTSTPLEGWHIYDADGEPGLFHVCPGSDPELGVCVHSDDAMSLSRIVAEISKHRCGGDRDE